MTRALVVVAAACAAAPGVLGLARRPLRDLSEQLEVSASWSAVPLDLMITAAAALALAGCGLWLLAVTAATAVEVATGVSSTAVRAVSPRIVRRLVLLTCGIAVGSGVLSPATAATDLDGLLGSRAAPTNPVELTGLPLPDRSLGETSAATERRRSPAPRPLDVDVVTVAAVEPAVATYRVRRGDSLWAVAERLLPRASLAEVDAAWRRIHHANRPVIGPDPDLIIPGTTLRLPRQPLPPRRTGDVPDRPAASRHGKDAS